MGYEEMSLQIQELYVVLKCLTGISDKNLDHTPIELLEQAIVAAAKTAKELLTKEGIL